jgi:shikimate dehydrogenase
MLLKVGLLGYQIIASKSPLLHAEFGKEKGIKVSYKLFDTSPAEFENTLYKLKNNMDLHGFNVTVPYKEKIIDFLDSYDDNVAITRSCNTVISSHGKWHGSSTDGPGWFSDISKKISLSKIKNILILGLGGAARAICYEINKQGLPTPDVCVRDIYKYEAFQALDKNIISFSSFAELSNYDLIINATSVGRNNDSIAIQNGIIEPNSVCYDMNYGKAHNWFKEYCEKRGTTCFDGFGMLQEQAKKSFILWYKISK